MSSFFWMFLTALSVTNACYPSWPLSFGLFRYKCISVSECKQRSFVIFRESCVRACPPGTKFFEDDQTCYNRCPLDSVETDKTCLNGSYCIKQDQVLHNGSCQNECPTDSQFIKYGTCYSMCPSDTIVKGTQCIFLEDCIQDYFVFNHSCVSVCPHSARFIHEGFCHDACPKNTVTNFNDTTCVPLNECTTERFVVFNSSCLPSCPPEAPHEVGGTCYSQCPNNFVLNPNQSNCISTVQCTDLGLYIYNNTCVQTCQKYILVRFDNQMICYDRCPDKYVIYVDRCIDSYSCTNEDDLYSVIFNGTCIPSCPDVAPYNHNGMCGGRCPSGTFEKDMMCIDNSRCIVMKHIWYGNRCVSECPHEAPNIYGHKCYLHCPHPYVSDNYTCLPVDECVSKGKYVFNNSCYSACPKESHSHINGRCSTMCPKGEVLNGTFCVARNECSLISDNTCVSSCPKGTPYVSQHMCLKQCPYSTVININDNQCIPYGNCTHKIYNRTCMKDCPFQAVLIYGNQCVNSCPYGFEAFSDMRCVLTAMCKRFSNGTIIQNKTSCLDSCPHYAPYIYTNRTVCLKRCPKDTVTEGFDCLDEYRCQGVVYKHMCLKSCPPEAPSNYFEKCYVHCPFGTVLKGKECVDDALCNAVFNQTCIPDGQCPKEAKYKSKKICYEQCPEDMLIDNNGTDCINKHDCGEKNGYINDNFCLPECPNGFVSDPTINSNSCIDLSIKKREAAIMALLMVITLVCLSLLIWNPKKPMQRREASTDVTEEGDTENRLGGIRDYMARRDRRRAVQNEVEMTDQQMNIVNERPREAREDDIDLIVVHTVPSDDVSADDEPLLCERGDDTANSIDDDALLFGDGNEDPDCDGDV